MPGPPNNRTPRTRLDLLESEIEFIVAEVESTMRLKVAVHKQLLRLETRLSDLRQELILRSPALEKDGDRDD